MWRNRRVEFAPRKGVSLLSHSLVRPKEMRKKKKETCSSGTGIIVVTWFRGALLGLWPLFGQVQNSVTYYLPMNLQLTFPGDTAFVKLQSLFWEKRACKTHSLQPGEKSSSLVFSNHNLWNVQLSLQTDDHCGCLTNDSSKFHLYRWKVFFESKLAK